MNIHSFSEFCVFIDSGIQFHSCRLLQILMNCSTININYVRKFGWPNFHALKNRVYSLFRLCLHQQFRIHLFLFLLSRDSERESESEQNTALLTQYSFALQKLIAFFMFTKGFSLIKINVLLFVCLLIYLLISMAARLLWIWNNLIKTCLLIPFKTQSFTAPCDCLQSNNQFTIRFHVQTSALCTFD